MIKHLAPHAAFVTVEAEPPEFKPDAGRNIHATAFIFEEMANTEAATKMLVVQSLRDGRS